MVTEISQATTPPSGPTRLAASMVWLPAPQAKSRTRIPVRIPAASRSVSVAVDNPAENICSHFAHPGAAFSQVWRSSDFKTSAVSEPCFSDCIASPPKSYALSAGCSRMTKHIISRHAVSLREVRFTTESGDLLVRTKCPLSGRQRHSNYSMISCGLCLFPIVGMPSDKNQHDEKPNHVGDRHMPTVAKPGTDRLCLRILV